MWEGYTALLERVALHYATRKEKCWASGCKKTVEALLHNTLDFSTGPYPAVAWSCWDLFGTHWNMVRPLEIPA